MRLFQIKLSAISDYTWARDNDQYRETYKEQIETADKELAARSVLLAELGIEANPDVPLVVTATQVIDLKLKGAEFTVIRELRPGQDDRLAPADFMAEFRTVAEKLLAAPALSGHKVHAAYNQTCEVHMPGQALSTYNELMLAEDSCTDALQRSLDDGWRIIAACPQPDARRPDYVLGRYNPAREVGDSQARRQR